MEKHFLIYLLFINLITFIIYYIDKQKAKKNKWRISEKTLILLGICGGCFGAGFAMLAFRHKVKKWKFRLTIPIICLIYTAVIIKVFII